MKVVNINKLRPVGQKRLMQSSVLPSVILEYYYKEYDIFNL